MPVFIMKNLDNHSYDLMKKIIECYLTIYPPSFYDFYPPPHFTIFTPTLYLQGGVKIVKGGGVGLGVNCQIALYDFFFIRLYK